MQKESVENYEFVKNSKGIIHLFQLLRGIITISCKYAFKIIMKVPKSFLITILQELHIFPFFLFGYVYFKYKALLTEELVK
jgi:hypothetical protein